MVRNTQDITMRSLNRIGLVFFGLTQLSLGVFAQPGIITTMAGTGTSGFSGDSGPATAAQLSAPRGVAIDSEGNLYVADQENNRIRKITAGGVITTVAGNGIAGFGGDGLSATAAMLASPSGVAVDPAGNLYIADCGNNRVRKVSAAGVISTIGGNGIPGFGGDGSPATKAQLNCPAGVAVSSSGSIYIADSLNSRIRKVSLGMISTVAGNGIPGFGGDGGVATKAQLNRPSGVAVDAAGNVYIGDYGNHRIRKVSVPGLISTAAGNGTQGFGGDGSPAAAAQLDSPSGVAVDAAGNLYISDSGNNRIRKVSAGMISTVAGNGGEGPCGDGLPATAAQLIPFGLAVDSPGNLFIADYGNNRIRMVTAGSASDLFFPQVAVGGGYSTLFTVTNAGAVAASGNLTLTDQEGNPLSVSATLTDSSGITHPASAGSAFDLTIPPGGTVLLSANGSTTSSPLKVGWGRLEVAAGSLSGVATYEQVVDGSTRSIVGVLHTQPFQYVTIPVDNSSGERKLTAYAIANPGSQTISVKLALVAQDGSAVDDTVAVTLAPGQQTARYLSQDLDCANFKGSLVFRGQARATFTVLGLVEKQSLLTAVPLITGKAPGVPE
jgi:sugar lactone lactonase YvrE